MKRFLLVMLTLFLCVIAVGCKGGESGAREVLEGYLQNLQDRTFEAAYDCLSDFDKTNITLEEFTEWREVSSEIQSIQSYSIGAKVDKFKNYEYKGARYNKAYGYLVAQELDKHQDINLTGYDSKEYHIMVGQQDGDWKIAFLILDLKSVTDQYKRKLEEVKADQ